MDEDGRLDVVDSQCHCIVDIGHIVQDPIGIARLHVKEIDLPSVKIGQIHGQHRVRSRRDHRLPKRAFDDPFGIVPLIDHRFLVLVSHNGVVPEVYHRKIELGLGKDDGADRGRAVAEIQGVIRETCLDAARIEHFGRSLGDTVAIGGRKSAIGKNRRRGLPFLDPVLVQIERVGANPVIVNVLFFFLFYNRNRTRTRFLAGYKQSHAQQGKNRPETYR